MFINNEWVNSLSGRTFPTYNPATEEVIANVQEADKDDVDRAVTAARQAFDLESEWRILDASVRGSMLHKLAQLLKRDKEYLGVRKLSKYSHLVNLKFKKPENFYGKVKFFYS